MAKIGLVACAAKKQSCPARAEELYTSTLFLKSRAYAQNRCDNWFILSAKHGLVRPGEVLEPYEKTLNRMPRAERRNWAARVWQSLRPLLCKGDVVTILAGARYREDLVNYLEEDGFTWEAPLEGIRIGEQLKWLNANSK